MTIPDYSDTVDRLNWIQDNATQAEISKTFDLLAMPFLLAAVIVYVLLGRERSPKLAWTGGILLGIGLVGLTAAQGVETLEFSLAIDGRFDLDALADIADNASTAPLVAMFIMFLPGVFFGLIITTISLWRSRALPRAAVLLLPVFIILDVPFQQPIPAHLIALAAAIWFAVAILTASSEPQQQASAAPE